ncbi:diaminopimelate decarboxylase [Longirhabdus pacifica]|uniref:diaminopimelate decarboxylase n=1 Tax=Longirhabdus pacifica TaxID=2305227 RepID=UPI0013E8D11B|nr:diaminopimelate decarboxylase [Longirhabdus pacifica]
MTDPIMKFNTAHYIQLAKEYGTPLYIYDQSVIQQHIYSLKQHLHPAVQLFYSMKANPNPSIIKTIYEEQVNVEICSPYELEIALAAGVSPRHMMYLGPNKSEEEITSIIEKNIKYFIVESIQEIQTVQRIAKNKNITVCIGIRFNPKSSAHGARLKMGGTARQFGIDETTLVQTISTAKSLSHVHICGLHSYHGTRILNADTIADNMKNILHIADRLQVEQHIELQYVGLGGGFGIPYYDKESPLPLAQLTKQITPEIETYLQRYPNTQLLAESGRFLVALSGTYVSQVRYLKQSQSTHFAMIDGGIHHHAAAGGVGMIRKQHFPIQLLTENDRDRSNHKDYHIAGPLCTPDDVVAKNITLPELRVGDYIAITHSGAYGLTFSPILFLSHRLPREVLIYQDKHVMIRDHNEYMFPTIRTL